MNFQTRSHQGVVKMPTTTVQQLLDNNLIIFLRSWGSHDYDQKFTQEVMHFLSTAQADIEVTSPFDYLENLSSLANKVRISLLLAHDYFYKLENKNSFSIGFEVALFISDKSEIAWATVGRFNVHKITNQTSQIISACGTDRDRQVLLPVDLLGVEKDFELRCGSVRRGSDHYQEALVVSSCYDNSLEFKVNEAASDWTFEPSKDDGTYWFSKIKSE